ncbi:hypothetical protein [Adhaeribacter aquaticus]|uniref:hypothetical protein n=1 Tax=Adhaeribacter aquaticus TaxID=299567 RepID=UPI00047DD8AB|nr:hypothetical protein [Adhaeribacter aquaticus]
MKKTLLLLLLLALCLSFKSFAQHIDSVAAKPKFTVDAGVDILNNFLWRGIPLDQGPNLQPTLILSHRNVKLSFLGSYSFKYNFNNIMTLLTYDIAVGAGTITPSLTHYYYPYDPVRISDYRKNPESFSHTTEAGIQYLGTKFPIRIYTSINVANDPEKSTYGEVAYKFNVNGIGFEPFVGVVFTESPNWHAAEQAGLLNVGFNTTKSIKFSDSFSLPLTGTLSYHTQLDMFNVMVRMSFF